VVPAGVGKTFLAQALGYSAIRAGRTVRFLHADELFRAMTQARVDNSLGRTFRSFLSPDLLILDDLGLHKLTAQQSADLYEPNIGRHRASSFVITSNRASGKWLSNFLDPILDNIALDRLANASFQILIERASYREKLSPHRKLLGGKGGH
jgi:DNA replication protein DnaC